MGKFLILVGLLSVCSLSFSQDCQAELQENIDFPGTDIKFVYAADVMHCQRLCTDHPSCLFFTFVRPDWTRDKRLSIFKIATFLPSTIVTSDLARQISRFQDRSDGGSIRHFYCYLKSTPSGQPNVQTPLLGVTSGYSLKPCGPNAAPCFSQVYQNVDFPEADYRFFFAADYEECQRACTQDPSCQFFTFINDLFTPERIRHKCHLKFSWAIPLTPIVEPMAGLVSGFSHHLDLDVNPGTACERKLFPSTAIPGSEVLKLPAASPEHCHAMCTAHPKCTFFSFEGSTFACRLKHNQDEMVVNAKDGVTSGLPSRFCQPDNDWIKVAYEGVDFRGSDIGFELMDDAESCQKACTNNVNCQFYTYVSDEYSNPEFRRRCYQKRSITIPAPPKVAKLNNVVSGFTLRNCVL